jgi:hypothetical protein
MACLIHRVALLLAVVAALGGTTAPARADVTPSGSVTSMPLIPTDPTLRVFSGTVSPFGAVQGVLQIHPDFTTGTFTGELVMVTRNGLVFGTIAGQFTNMAGTTYAETITFTGGTGRYRHISGEADVLGAFNLDGTATDTIVGGSIHF